MPLTVALVIHWFVPLLDSSELLVDCEMALKVTQVIGNGASTDHLSTPW